MMRRVCNRVLGVILAAALAMTPAMTIFAAQEEEIILLGSEDEEQDPDEQDEEDNESELEKSDRSDISVEDNDDINESDNKDQDEEDAALEEIVDEDAEALDQDELSEEEELSELLGVSKLMSEDQDKTLLANSVKSGTLDNGMTWELVDGKLTITVSDDETIKNRTVIPDFWVLGAPMPEWHDYASEITEIELDERITKIGIYAFTDTNITEITIPKNIEMTYGGAFKNCKNLSKVVLESIHGGVSQTYLGCNISEVVFPEGIEEIPNNLFQDATFAPGFHLVIPKTVKRIGASAFSAYDFSGEGGISSIEFEEGSQLEEIDDWAFLYTNIRKIEFPSTLKRIGDQAFCRTALEEVVIPDGVVQVDVAAFIWMKNLKKITFPSSVRYMGLGLYGDEKVEDFGDEYIGEREYEYVVSNANGSKVKFVAPTGSLAWRHAVRYNGYQECNYDISGATPASYNAFLVFFNANGGDDGYLEKGTSSLEGGLTGRFSSKELRKISNFDETSFTSADGFIQYMNGDDSVLLTGTEFVRPGYTLTGWKASNGKTYGANAELKGIAKNGEVVAITAQWVPTKYTIKYNNNGGALNRGIKVSTTYTVTGNAFDLPTAATITKTGYTFKGWYDNKDFEGDAITRVELGTFAEQTLNLFAKWEKNSYTLNLDKNAADAAMAEGQDDSVVLEYDESYTLSKNLFTRNGYTFASWNTKADGRGKKYATTAVVKNLMTGATDNESITLFAQWTPNTYKITYDLQGGKQSGAPTSYKTNTGATLKTPVKTGYKFMGWLSDNEDVVISENNTISKDAGNYGKVKLAAQWEAIKYSVVVMHDSVEENYTDDVISYGEIVDMGDVAKALNGENSENQSIDYFTTQPNGKGTKYYVNKYYKNLASVEGAKVVLYPHWGSKTYRIVYEADFGDNSDEFSLSDVTNLSNMPLTYDPVKGTKLVIPTVKGFDFDGFEVNALTAGAGTEWTIVPDKRTKNITLSKWGKGDLKVTMKFKPVAYTVVLMPNAKNAYEVTGTDYKKAVNHTYTNVAYSGEDVTMDLDVDSLRRFGYDFVGFNTLSNGRGTYLTEDENGRFVLSGLSQKNTTVKCYAIWKGVDYNISYYESIGNEYSSGGDYTALTAMEANTKTNRNPATGVGGKAVKFNNPVKTGYAFTGWTLVPAEPSAYGVHYTTRGANGPITGLSTENEIDAVAIANFTPISYKLKISSNGGVIAATKKAGSLQLGTFGYDDDVKDNIASKLNAQFNRKGYVFAGFALDSRSKKMIMDETGALLGDFAGETEVAGLATKNNQTVTVYTVWEKVVADKPVITSATLQDGSLSLNYTVGKTAADTEYVIEYSNSLLFRNKVSNTVAKTSANIEGLTSGKTYYIRVKQTKTDSQGNTVSGAWSKTVKVK